MHEDMDFSSTYPCTMGIIATAIPAEGCCFVDTVYGCTEKLLSIKFA
jgi:hypothetical protein